MERKEGNSIFLPDLTRLQVIKQVDYILLGFCSVFYSDKARTGAYRGRFEITEALRLLSNVGWWYLFFSKGSEAVA